MHSGCRNLATVSQILYKQFIGREKFSFVTCLCSFRLDSLIVLDVLLEHCPSLVAESAARLLPNLVRLIAQPRVLAAASGYGGHTPKMASSSLIVNPNSRLSTQKWRVRVLQRLAVLFEVIVSHSERQRAENTLVSSATVVMVTDTTTHRRVRSSVQVTPSSLHQFSLRFCISIVIN